MCNKNILSIGILSGLMVALPSQADILYTATHISGPDDSLYSSQYFDINNSGQLLARVVNKIAIKAPMLSFISINNKWIEINQIGLPPEANGRIYKIPVDINNNGEVLAIAYTNDDGRHSFVAKFSKIRNYADNVTIKQTNRDLGKEIIGSALNDKKQVVGYYRTPLISGVQHAFLDTNGSFTDLGTLGGSSSAAYSINNHGQVTGVSDMSNTESHAFVIGHSRKKIMKDLGTLGGSYSIGKSINDRGQVVGNSTVVNNGNQYTHAFISNKYFMKDLGTLGGNNSFTNKINAYGQVVGTAEVADGSLHAFTTKKGVMTDLNKLVDPKTLIALASIDPTTSLSTPLILKNAVSINDKGEILAEGYDNQSYLLTPVKTHNNGRKSNVEKTD